MTSIRKTFRGILFIHINRGLNLVGWLNLAYFRYLSANPSIHTPAQLCQVHVCSEWGEGNKPLSDSWRWLTAPKNKRTGHVIVTSNVTLHS